MTIGEVARRTGASVKALRFYDELGILEVAGRSEANYRLFTDGVLRCVEQIRRLQEAGLTLRQLQAIVEARRRGKDPAPLLRRAFAEALARTERILAALEARRERLREIVGANDPAELTLQCAGGCSLSEKTAPLVTAQDRRDSWPAKREQSNRWAPTSLAARFTTTTPRGLRRSSPSSQGSSFARSR